MNISGKFIVNTGERIHLSRNEQRYVVNEFDILVPILYQ